ncbi:methyltransferase domain-containing protein [Azospirillum sp. B21]|uniref:methyltransferase domain-containing protein n=1 Tax=Azospirillum sp. B21 TaxID=2607496 RepID=UPI0011F0335F|nr:methyltransferase domain-containing protein [Azospirillum sp. B21]KAA0577947.1 methyltransferase domain-containing protein [Azospirillum sp. B21]
MKELSKSIQRRLHDSRFLRRYFVGNGVDIGGKPDPLSLYQEFFPLMESVRIWDLEDGDAQFMHGVESNVFDFVHSSHCLEHMVNPTEALQNWFRIVRPGGYLIITVPDEDLYEQGIFPSTFNADHKHTFTIFKRKSWSNRSINLTKILSELPSQASVEKIELLDATNRFLLPRYDQTKTPVAESAIEFIIRKTTLDEAEAGMRQSTKQQPEPRDRVHYNQYEQDYRATRAWSKITPPFTDETEL